MGLDLGSLLEYHLLLEDLGVLEGHHHCREDHHLEVVGGLDLEDREDHQHCHGKSHPHCQGLELELGLEVGLEEGLVPVSALDSFQALGCPL